MIKPDFRSIPINELTVSLEDFQGRSEAYSSVTYNRIKDEVRDGTFNFSALPPIMVWKDSRTNKWVILGGHSRTAIFTDLSLGKYPMHPKYSPADFKEIHAQVFFANNEEDALEQARKVAQESNLAGQQSDVDFAFRVVKPLREKLKGAAYWDKMDNLFGGNKRKIHKLSFLSPNGKAVHMLKATENLSDSVQRDTVKTIAEYIGLARERLTDLTDAHENELYDWLVKTFAEEAKAKKEGRKLNVVISSENKFLELVSSRMLRLGWKPEHPLNLDLVGAESVYKTTFDQTKKEKIEQIKELQKKYDEDKHKLIKLNWSIADIENKLDPQEKYIIRLQRELAQYENKISEVQAAERSELSLFDSPPTPPTAPVAIKQEETPNVYKSKLETLVGLMRLENMNVGSSPLVEEKDSWGRPMIQPEAFQLNELNHYKNLLKNIDQPLYAHYNKKNVEKIIAELEQKLGTDEITEAWNLIKPEIEKVKKELPGAHGFSWWKSRVSEFFYQGALKKVDWEVKNKTEKLFPEVWEKHKDEIEPKQTKKAEPQADTPLHSLTLSHVDQYKSMFKGRFDFSVLEALPNGTFLLEQLDYWLSQFEERMQFYHGQDPYNKRHTKGFGAPQTKYSHYIYKDKPYDPHTIREETGYTDVDMLKQICETAIHIFADSIIGRFSEAEVYNKLCEFYAIQPRVVWRSTKSMQLQQYSTPVPIAYLMSKFCIKIPTLGDKYLEPSAGTGLLTIGTPPEYWTVNEIDKDRLLCLKLLGFKKTFDYDGTMALPFTEKFDAVITNPPFNSFEKTDFRGYKIQRKEFVMAAHALECLKETGKAAIIIGNNMKYDKEGYIAPFGSDGVFFNYLYHHFNVVDVISIDGALYKAMGANAPIRIILIDGERPDTERLVAINRVLPPRLDEIKGLNPDQTGSPHFVKDFKTLYQRFQKIS